MQNLPFCLNSFLIPFLHAFSSAHRDLFCLFVWLVLGHTYLTSESSQSYLKG